MLRRDMGTGSASQMFGMSDNGMGFLSPFPVDV